VALAGQEGGRLDSAQAKVTHLRRQQRRAASACTRQNHEQCVHCRREEQQQAVESAADRSESHLAGQKGRQGCMHTGTRTPSAQLSFGKSTSTLRKVQIDTRDMIKYHTCDVPVIGDELE
jgi:hypothetical protein